ncbi:MAG: Protein lysine acetyltransferase Pat [Candidatus Omnitrophica bacterium]|nr:Protein lysine acetyltransferase Pat [Candidatus Omnitrophota bacterium]
MPKEDERGAACTYASRKSLFGAIWYNGLMKTAARSSWVTDKDLILLPSLSHDIWRGRSHPLDAIFRPKSVAIIGATEKTGSVGKALLENLTEAPFRGELYAVNPKYREIGGLDCYKSILDCPAPVSLAVIATPAPTIPQVIEDCGKAGVKGAIVISAGFKERGAEGEALEKQTLEIARRYGIRLIGPNCLGVMNTRWGLNATFAAGSALKGNVGFISQSGALCTAVLDWSRGENIGFSAFISAGSMADVGWGDLIDYLGDDPDTHSILIYMESIGDARPFLSAAREVALTKPVIVLKAGRTEAAAKAAISHTGSIAGSDDVLDAAFRRCGVLRVNEIRDLFNLTEILSKQPKPKGPRLAIVTNAGGPGVLATDALVQAGGELAVLSKQTHERLDRALPAHWSHNNPVDVLGDAGADRYAEAIEAVQSDAGVDGTLVILTPQAMTEPTLTAEVLRRAAEKSGKPLLASWMGDADVRDGRRILSKARIPDFPYPDEAARLFQYTWRYSENLKALYETPQMTRRSADVEASAAAGLKQMLEDCAQAGRTVLPEEESKRVLAAYGIPTVRTIVAHTPDEAVKAAAELGYPVVLKLHSQTITHKSDVGGVRLNLQDAAEVRAAYDAIKKGVQEKAGGGFDGVTVQPMIRTGGYELILGSSPDPQLGPVLLFGIGGKLVELFKDHAIGLPPLNPNLAVRLMEETTIYKALKGVRGERPADLALLADILVRFSRLVAEQRRIKEIEINPLLVSSQGIIALDARVVLYPKSTADSRIPKLAIRPYPSEYVTVERFGQEEVTIRPIRPEDEPLIVDFHHSLSGQSIRRRYFREVGLSERIAHERLTRVCFNDYDREIALVAEGRDSSGAAVIQAVCRLSRQPGSRGEALFSILVADAYQGKGLGKRLLSLLLKVAEGERLSRVWAYLEPDNAAIRGTCEKLGFSVVADRDNPNYLIAEYRTGRRT